MITELEEAAVAAGLALRASSFGRSLRGHDPRGDRRHKGSGSLAQHEIQHGPPLHRTLFALEYCEATGAGFDRTAETDYLLWVARALEAVGSLAARCWGDIPLDIRSEVVDQDDLGPIQSRYIPGARKGAVDSGAMAFEGLGRGDVGEALDKLVREVLATECYPACLQSVRDLRGQGGRRALSKFARRVDKRLNVIHEAAPNLIAFGAPARTWISEAYIDAPAAVRAVGQAVQAHNELVQSILWTLLGLAEHPSEPVLTTALPAASRLRRKGRHADLTLTTQGWSLGLLGNPPFPVAIQADTPVDGVYLTRSQLIQALFDPLTDVTGRRLGALEAAV